MKVIRLPVNVVCTVLTYIQEVWVKHKPAEALKCMKTVAEFLSRQNPLPTSQFLFETEAKRQRMKDERGQRTEKISRNEGEKDDEETELNIKKWKQ